MIIKGNITTNNILYRPIKIVMIYFIGLIVLYIWGPFEWRTQNPPVFYLYLFLCQSLIYIGYKITMNKLLRRNESVKQEESEYVLFKQTTIVKLLKVLIAVNLVMTVLMTLRNIGLSSFSINNLWNEFLNGLENPGLQYDSKVNSENLFGGNILAPLSTLTAPFLWPVLPLSIIYFKKINVFNKGLVLLTIIIESVRWISTGTNKGIIDLILIILSVLFLKQLQKSFHLSNKIKARKRKVVAVTIIAMILVIIGLSVFQNNISSRINNNYGTVSAITNNTIINTKSPIMKIMPETLHPLVIYVTSYLTQGYYGLSLALDEPYIPMFGVGNSYFLISNFEGLLSKDIWKNTFQARLAYEGWNPFVNWHSIYTWLANDFSFLGVLIIMFYLGKYFAVVCYKSIVQKDSITSVILCLLFICFFYFSCNNQVLSMPSTFMAFWGINIYWFYKSKIKRRG